MSEEEKRESAWGFEEAASPSPLASPPASPPAPSPTVPLLPVHQASPMPLVLAGVSTGQMLLLKRFKDAVRQGKPIPNMHIIQPVLLGGAGACAFGGLLSALGFLRYVAIALARATTKYSITFITHDSHQVLKALLLPAGIVLRSVSTPAVLTPEQKRDSFPDSLTSGNTVPKCEVSLIRARRVEIHMEECLDAIESQESNGTISFIAINFFALVGLSEFTITLLPVYRFLRQEGWHIAELLNVRAPASFERSFRQVYPRLYKRLQRASAEEVGWKDVTHWMWPLFTDRWTSWRVRKLRLSACPLTDPVTELPVHDWPRSVPLLYGFSEKVVECPGYWPSSVRVCGFWLPPDRGVSGTTHLAPKLAEFLLRSADSKPVFIGLSSITSMGFLQNPLGMLQVVTDVLKAVNMRGVLFTAGHPSLEAVVTSAAGLATSCLEKEGLTLDHNLFCYSGSHSSRWKWNDCCLSSRRSSSGDMPVYSRPVLLGGANVMAWSVSTASQAIPSRPRRDQA
ncbi:hypothetical protein SELMODRAFT_437977 [Selaginella moellendorffii]|uniref:Uncharacterized protein n=1 Tax=Selaginella moellendorffii TaxID=88036 RepID=D8QSI3_SELML|nr:hypothetical protein SELMODRAFT_437977 [Selaginella moellendorffii]